jgi:hypothetical protein
METRDLSNTPENYATDKVADSASRIAKKGAGVAKRITGRMIRKGRQAWNSQRKNREANTIRQRTKGGIRSADRSIRTAKYSVNATTRTIRTNAQSAKAAVKTAKTGVKAARISAKSARAAARAAVKGMKLLVKAVTTAIKATTAAIKVGGWIVLLIVIVVGAILFIVNSAFGILYSNEDTGDEGTISMSEAVAEISGDYSATWISRSPMLLPGMKT